MGRGELCRFQLKSAKNGVNSTLDKRYRRAIIKTTADNRTQGRWELFPAEMQKRPCRFRSLLNLIRVMPA